jgi:hypothetical protein
MSSLHEIRNRINFHENSLSPQARNAERIPYCNVALEEFRDFAIRTIRGHNGKSMPQIKAFLHSLLSLPKFRSKIGAVWQIIMKYITETLATGRLQITGPAMCLKLEVEECSQSNERFVTAVA